jgi:hypothetical protein
MTHVQYEVVRYSAGARAVVGVVRVPVGRWQYADAQLAAASIRAHSGYPPESHRVDIPSFRAHAEWATEEVL